MINKGVTTDRFLINVQHGLLLVDKGPIQVDVYENNSTPKSLKRKEVRNMGNSFWSGPIIWL